MLAVAWLQKTEEAEVQRQGCLVWWVSLCGLSTFLIAAERLELT